jgi:hypothetical protein
VIHINEIDGGFVRTDVDKLNGEVWNVLESKADNEKGFNI